MPHARQHQQAPRRQEKTPADEFQELKRVTRQNFADVRRQIDRIEATVQQRPPQQRQH